MPEIQSNESFPLTITTNLPFDCKGYIVIDSLRNETSSGGLRIMPGLSVDEVKALAGEMSLKFAFNGLPRGGAKSGINLPEGFDMKNKPAVMTAFGKAIGPIIRSGIYYPGMDMNCGPEDLYSLYRGAGIEIGKPTDTSFFTALSVGHSLLAATSDKATPENPMTIAVEGFGSVGAYLAGMLPEDSYRFVAISTIQGCAVQTPGFQPEVLTEARSKFGDDLVNHLEGSSIFDLGEIFRTEVDILIPAARTWSISRKTAENIGAGFIIPAANVPFADGAVEILTNRGIICLPGFITNSGGVYGSSLFDSGVPVNRVEEISKNYYTEIVSSVINKGRETGLSPVRVAEQVAQNRLSKSVRNGSGGKIRERILKKLIQKRVLPSSMSAKKVISRFAADQENLVQEIQALS